MGELLRALAQEGLAPPVVSYRRGLLNSGTALEPSRLGSPDAPLGYLPCSISGIRLLVNYY